MEKVEKQTNKTPAEKIVGVARGLKITMMVGYVLTCIAVVTFIVLAIVFPLCNVIPQLRAGEVVSIFVGLAVSAFFVLNILWPAGKMFATIEHDKSPFGPVVTKNLKKIGVAVILWSIVPSLVQSTILASVVPDSELYVSIYVGGIVSGLLLYFLGYFFAHGADLQKQTDETL